jgi:DUF971 family protein
MLTNFVKKIYQKDNTTFTIEWTDGKIYNYRLSDLQKNCSCARCRDEKTGQGLIDPEKIPVDLSARRIFNIGRYALKVEFSSGCSRGIYSFAWLQQSPSIEK